MKNLKKILAAALALAAIGACMTGCQRENGETVSDNYVDTITMIWAPNESAEDYDIAREEFSRLIKQATGKEVKHQLTTDYAVAIEAMASGKAEVEAFCDTEMRAYANCTEGEENKVGSVYSIKDDATAPFDQVQGEKFVLIASTPVLNGPFFYNSETLSPEDVKAIQDLFTSDAVTNNEKIFIPKGSDAVGVFEKKGDSKFVLVEDSWFDPIREMSK